MFSIYPIGIQVPSQKVGLGWVPGGSKCLLRRYDWSPRDTYFLVLWVLEHCLACRMFRLFDRSDVFRPFDRVATDGWRDRGSSELPGGSNK